ncbi:hypothetical protein ASPFODRAFT_605634 [Aspergillus luchuensis CBS 106.47]|uniref:Uncharacterized protein n=1 Tax=Aspergillus luchuensis (strain CBS 106.47) TaxID=1137211 RepID=A0A1M3TIG9_ASPLC|nr:hypothetical protein ASPFODRAFT_605634 [Aspergillus luchuensis CBS 106.47]
MHENSVPRNGLRMLCPANKLLTRLDTRQELSICSPSLISCFLLQIRLTLLLTQMPPICFCLFLFWPIPVPSFNSQEHVKDAHWCFKVTGQGGLHLR